MEGGSLQSAYKLKRMCQPEWSTEDGCGPQKVAMQIVNERRNWGIGARLPGLSPGTWSRLGGPQKTQGSGIARRMGLCRHSCIRMMLL